jgi:hypothetical protein
VCRVTQPSLPHESVANYSPFFVQGYTTQEAQTAAGLDTDTVVAAPEPLPMDARRFYDPNSELLKNWCCLPVERHRVFLEFYDAMDTQHGESILSKEEIILDLNHDMLREKHIYEKHVAAAGVSKGKIDALEKEIKLYQTSLSHLETSNATLVQQMLISKDMVSGECTPAVSTTQEVQTAAGIDTDTVVAAPEPLPMDARTYELLQLPMQQHETKRGTKRGLSSLTEEEAKEVGTGPVGPEGPPQKKARN